MEAIAILLVFAALLIAGPAMGAEFQKRQEEINRRLVMFIIENYDDLAMGATLDYNGVPISKRSVITRFRYCYSYIVMTSSRSSAMYLVDGLDTDEAKNAKLTCQLITAFSGWWGIPWGIINSIQYLVSNGAKNGTNDDTVGDLMQRIQNANNG